jgi:hypothetical protein
MTALLITVDTELSAAMHQQGVSPADNVRSSIWGECPGGAFGIGWQMDVMDRHGLKGVYFLDPMPALVYGRQWLEPVVGGIVGRGHEVQLHIHSEWLQWAGQSPVEGRLGRNIADFALADQITLLGLARDLLEQAGAPRISAFRAGNFGANDDTLRALAAIGLHWDSSVNAAYLGGDCDIAVDPATIGPVPHLGMAELPVSGIADRPGRFRPAQVCAMSAAEMRAGLSHAAAARHPAFVVVTHSFEMLSRDRQRPNRLVMRRFEQLCATAEHMRDVEPAGFADLSPALTAPSPGRAAPSTMRTALRIGEQLWGNWRYERQLLPG